MTQTLDGPMVAPLAGGAPQSMVIFLHGYGSNGADLISLAGYWQASLPHTVFMAPNAPQPCPGAPDGYQWWGLGNPDPQARAAGVAQPAPILNAFIDAQLARYDLGEDRLALVGFSQGTMMALHVGPRRANALAGIVGYSGMLADPDQLTTEIATSPPMLLVHGDADPMVPVASLGKAQEVLSRLDVAVTTHISPGLGHSIDEPGLVLGQRFLVDVLG